MISVGELIRSVRYLLRDMQGVAVSDFEIVEAINRGAALLYSRMAENSVQVAAKKVELTVKAGGQVALPADFHNVRWVFAKGGGECVPTPRPSVGPGEYRIVGDRFEAPKGAYIFEYYGIPPRVAGYEDELAVPAAVRRCLEDIVAALVGGDVDRAEQAALLCCRELAGAELVRLTDPGPVKIWGGRA